MMHVTAGASRSELSPRDSCDSPLAQNLTN